MAVGQSITHTSTALETIVHTQNQINWEAIDKTITRWRPTLLIIGDPLTLDGHPTDITNAARNFAKLLKEKYHLEIKLQDERMSSIEASYLFKQQRQTGNRKKQQKGDIDNLAAKIIVERWLLENA